LQRAATYPGAARGVRWYSWPGCCWHWRTAARPSPSWSMPSGRRINGSRVTMMRCSRG